MNASVPSSGNPETLALSLLSDYLFCHRRAGLKILEHERSSNRHTAEGDVLHDRVDTPGYHVLRGVKVLRALPVWSDSLGLSGKCDVVEQHPDGSLVPVEFKKSKTKNFINDDVQVCAQAMCIEESCGVTVNRGSIFFCGSRQRREVELSNELRSLTRQTAADLHQMLECNETPLAVRQPKCRGCSLVGVCLPDAMRLKRGVSAWFESTLSLPTTGN